MKRLFASLGWTLLLLPLVSVAGVRAAIGSDSQNSENRSVQPFSSVSSSGSFDVHIQFGNRESLRLEGDKEEFPRIETTVENGILKIRYRKNNGWKWSGGKMDIYITAKKLEGISLNGSGSIKVDGAIKASEFNASLSGSGNLNFNLNSSTLKAMLNGSGKISSWGNSEKTDISISGSGNFQGENLHTEIANIKLSGSGNVRINASNTINAAISGSGNIYYSGNAAINSKTSGSGRISKL